LATRARCARDARAIRAVGVKTDARAVLIVRLEAREGADGREHGAMCG
jgi:hypothetical protein